jgi:hypothetical protein
MIGTQTLAQQIDAIDWHLQEDEDGYLDAADMPEGWEYLGSGAYRHAFLGPDGIVYKVHTAFALNTGENENARQFDQWKELANAISLVGNVRMANCAMIGNVLTQEHVVGAYPKIEDNRTVESILRMVSLRFFDIHLNNYRVVDEQFVIFDW